jgi:hypothetical protein
MRYRVISKKNRVFRKKFGEYFARNLSETQERQLIGGGFIVRAPLAKKTRRPEAAVVVKETAPDNAPTEVVPAEAPPETEALEAPTDNPRRDEG